MRLPIRAAASGRATGAAGWIAVMACHAVAIAWVFGRALTGGLLYFRDLSTQYAPDYSTAAAALRSGTWPVWNPAANAGEPFLLSYPIDALALLIGGPRAPLGLVPALHLALALVGATLLARRLGLGPWGALAASAAYALGGFVLSTVNLVQLFEAAAWAPLVILSMIAVYARPDGRRLAGLALVLALQVSTMGVEIVGQTLLLGLALAGRRAGSRRTLLALTAALALAALLAAPAVLGTAALLRGTTRGEGFRPDETLAYSVHPVTLLEATLPRFLGDAHAFSDRDLWGRAYFPNGYPYLLSIYLGPIALLLAGQARSRLWWVAALGVVLALGLFGPLRWLPAATALPFRGPQKLLFLAHASVAILVGLGLERRMREPARRPWLLLLPGSLLAALVFLVWWQPGVVLELGSALAPPLSDPRGHVAATSTWPSAWLPTAVLLLVAGGLLARGGRWVALVAPLVALDLLTVNGGLNPLTDPSFYDLRPDVRTLVESAAGGAGLSGPRWYSYGVANTPGLTFEPAMRQARSDVWLYYLDRQSLLPRTPALDQLPGALEVDRTGWSPAGATLAVSESTPDHFADVYGRLRLAGVRWVLSFRPLTPALAVERSSVKLPEVSEPLRLFELRGALPRAYFVDAFEVQPDPASLARRLRDLDPTTTVLLAENPPLPTPRAREGSPPGLVDVRYQLLDPQTVCVTATTPAGYIVVLDGHHPDWSARDESGRAVPILRADGRYRAIPTTGGSHVYTFRYVPRWRVPALIALVLGVLATGLLAVAGGVSEFTAAPGTRRANLRGSRRQ